MRSSSGMSPAALCGCAPSSRRFRLSRRRRPSPSVGHGTAVGTAAQCAVHRGHAQRLRVGAMRPPELTGDADPSSSRGHACCHICIRDWGHARCHICSGTGLTAAHICTGTGLAAATSAPGLGQDATLTRLEPCRPRTSTPWACATSCAGRRSRSASSSSRASRSPHSVSTCSYHTVGKPSAWARPHDKARACARVCVTRA